MVGAAIGGALSAMANIYSTNQTNKANRELATLANQWSVEQWNRENAYNTPEEQRKRLEEAGFNPNLVYAQGNLMNEAAQSPAVTSAAGTQRAWQIDPLTAAQIANINADTDLKEKQAGQTSQQTQLTAKQMEDIDSIIKWRNQQNSESIERINSLVKGRELTDAQINRLSVQNLSDMVNLDISYGYLMNDVQRVSNDSQRLELEKKLNAASIRNLNADTRKKLAEANVTERQYQEMVATFALRKSDLANKVNLSAAQINQANATAKKLGIEYDNLYAEGWQSRSLVSAAESGGPDAIAAHAVMAIDHTVGLIPQLLKY